MASDLLLFFGTECAHCHEMDPLVKRLEKEEKVKFQRLEIWHNSKNASLMQDLDKGKCGGVPFFYNKKTGASICGSVSYEKLKKWALGK